MNTIAPFLAHARVRLCLTTLSVQWRCLSRVERAAVGLAPVLVLALLLALAQACQASVARGEQLRAAQNGLAGTDRVAVAPLAARSQSAALN